MICTFTVFCFGFKYNKGSILIEEGTFDREKPSIYIKGVIRWFKNFFMS